MGLAAGRRASGGRRARLGAAALALAVALGLALPSSGAKLAADELQTRPPGLTQPARSVEGAVAFGASPASAPRPRRPIIGTNDAAGWGPAPARTILRGGITWNRVELGSRYNTLASSRRAGFKALAIVGNVDDRTPLSTVDPSVWGTRVAAELRANPGISIAEAGNESYLKGLIAEPLQYGRMYLAAVEDMRAAGIGIPLLFNLTGDYPLGSWGERRSWSEDAHGGGWLRDAVDGVPGLASAILANGVSIHPYGALTENRHDDYGIASVAALEAVALAVLGSIPPFYVTEIGFDLGRCGAAAGACSQREQAGELRAAYTALLADPHVAGIWWYQSHDDSSGRFGFMNFDGTTRPAFSALSSFARKEGQ